MKPNQNNPENLPVPQENEQDSSIDIWEPPFERWLRIAELSLSNSAFSHFEVAPTPQTFGPLHRG